MIVQVARPIRVLAIRGWKRGFCEASRRSVRLRAPVSDVSMENVTVNDRVEVLINAPVETEELQEEDASAF